MNKKTIIFLAIAVLLAGYFYMTRGSQAAQSASAGATASVSSVAVSTSPFSVPATANVPATSAMNVKSKLEANRPALVDTKQQKDAREKTNEAKSAKGTPSPKSAEGTPEAASAVGTPSHSPSGRPRFQSAPGTPSSKSAVGEPNASEGSDAYNELVNNAPWNVSKNENASESNK